MNMLSSADSTYNSNSPYSPASVSYSPNPQPSAKVATTPHVPRQRLRPWLIDQINNRKTPGLDWLDLGQMIFKIPWKHFGRPGVDEYNDAMLFRNWALHTKKFQEGQPADISTWKTRFRCALHKLPDIEELNHLNQTEGDDPYRVYQFKRKEGDFKSMSSPMSSMASPMSSMASPMPSMNSPLNLPSDINPVALSPAPYGLSSDDGKQEYDSLGNDPLMNDELGNMLGIDDMGGMIDASLDLDPSMLNPTLNTDNNIMNPQAQQMLQNNVSLMQSLQQQRNEPQENISAIAVCVKLYYANREVGEKLVDNPKGLRIAFNPPPPLPDDIVREDTSQVVSHIFGPLQAEQIYFPHSNDQSTMKILECIKRGLVLQARNGEILATRLCRAKVFYSDSDSPANVKELPREHTTVVFDYVNEFLPQMHAYMLGQGPLPTYERYFSFGQKWSQTAPLRNNFIYINVAHHLAKSQLDQLENHKSEVFVSDPNMLDVIAKQIEDLRVNPSNT